MCMLCSDCIHIHKDLAISISQHESLSVADTAEVFILKAICLFHLRLSQQN